MTRRGLAGTDPQWLKIKQNSKLEIRNKSELPKLSLQCSKRARFGFRASDFGFFSQANWCGKFFKIALVNTSAERKRRLRDG